jgi:hypothetical protein
MQWQAVCMHHQAHARKQIISKEGQVFCCRRRDKIALHCKSGPRENGKSNSSNEIKMHFLKISICKTLLYPKNKYEFLFVKYNTFVWYYTLHVHMIRVTSSHMELAKPQSQLPHIYMFQIGNINFQEVCF